MAISRCLLIGAALGTCAAFVAHATAPHADRLARSVVQVASL